MRRLQEAKIGMTERVVKDQVSWTTQIKFFVVFFGHQNLQEEINLYSETDEDVFFITKTWWHVVECQGQRRKLWAEARSGKLNRNRMFVSPFSSVELLSSVGNKIQIFLLNLRFN